MGQNGLNISIYYFISIDNFESMLVIHVREKKLQLFLKRPRKFYTNLPSSFIYTPVFGSFLKIILLPCKAKNIFI